LCYRNMDNPALIKRASFPWGTVAEMSTETIREDLMVRGFDFSRRICAIFDPDTKEIIYEQGTEK
jgi:hypothetical protein